MQLLAQQSVRPPAHVRYESESGSRVDDPAESELDELLARLDGVDDSFASLTALDGSGYVQVGGGPTAFTVERRDVGADGTFRHFKAAREVHGDVTQRQIVVGDAEVTVRDDEVLDLRTVCAVFRVFLARHLRAPVADVVVWRDITPMFASED